VSHSRRIRRKHSLGRRPLAGTVPGTITVDPAAPQPVTTVLAYGPQKLVDRSLPDLQPVAGLLNDYRVTWINVDGLGNADLIQQLGRQFGLHPLALEDTVNTHQRAKADEFGDVLYVVLRMVQGPPLVTEQISFFVGSNFLITFQEDLEGDSLNSVRDRIRFKRGRIRDTGPDYLLYELLDAVVDGYFPVLERYGEWLDELDDMAESTRIGQTLADLHAVRRDLLYLRRVVWPLRDVMLALLRGGHSQITPETQVYLRDCYDHATQLIDILEIYRETCSDLRDFYYAKLSNRTNEIMRTLTVIATVFMPLSFIAGLYGMNFDHIPELHWRWGYPLCLSLMASSAGGFMYFFWRKGWLRSAEQRPVAGQSVPPADH
jgi:magnesium transporter